jgi:hypothetical protein
VGNDDCGCPLYQWVSKDLPKIVENCIIIISKIKN